RAVREAGEAVTGHDVSAVFREGREEGRKPVRGVRQVRVERGDERPSRGGETGLVGPTVAGARFGYDPGPFRGRDVPRPVPRIGIDDQDFEWPTDECSLDFVDHGADRGLFIHRRDDDGDLGHWRAMLGTAHKRFAVTPATAPRRTCIRRIRARRRSTEGATRTWSSVVASA